MTESIISVVASIAACILYALFLNRKVERLREYLGEAKSERRKKTLQRALIAAFNGSGREYRVALFGSALVFSLGLFLLQTPINTYENAQDYDGMIEVNDSILSKAIMMIENPEIIRDTDGPSPSLRESSIEKCHALKESAEKSLVELPREKRKLIILTIYGSIIFVAVTLIAARAIYLILLCLKFESELAKFTYNIQQLATKAELSDLWLSELDIKDVNSLSSYFEVATKIAARHGVEKAIDYLYFWKESSDATVK